MDAKRILIAESGSGYGGTAKYLSGLLPLLDKKALEVTVVSYGDGPFMKAIEKDGFSVHYQPGWKFSMRSLAAAIIVIPSMIRWLKKNDIHLVHLNNELHSHIPLIIASRLAGVKILCHLHGWRELTKIERWAGRFIDLFITVTAAGAEFYKKQLGSAKIKPVLNGLPAQTVSANGKERHGLRSKLGIRENEVLVTLIGRLIPLKGHLVFLNSLKQSKNPNLKALIVGNADASHKFYEKTVHEKIKELEISDQIQFLNWQENLAPIYAASDVIVQPSIQPESFGYVALEGMKAGKPVIASRIGGLVDVVAHEKTGLLVDPGNAEDLARAIHRIASDQVFAASLGQAGQQRADTLFTMERNAAEVTYLYGQLLMECPK